MDGRTDPITEGLSDIVRLIGEGNLKAAMDRCSVLLRQDPQNAPALHMMGIIAARMGDQGLAITFVERAHQIEPDWREYAAVLAYFCASVARVTDALYYAKLATVLPPHPLADLLMPPNMPIGRAVFDGVDASMHWLLAEAAFHSGKFAEAAQEAEAELRINPERYDTLLILARARHALGQHDVARGHLLAAIRLKPDAAPALRWMGDVLLSQGEHDQSLACHRASLALEAEDDVVAAAHVLTQLPWQASGNHAATAELAAELRTRANPPRKPAIIDQTVPYLGIVWDQCHAGPLTDFVLPLLERLGDVIVYRLNRRTDAVTETVRSKVMRFQDCADLDAATFDRIIAGDNPRFLINLSNTGDQARYPQLAGSAACPVIQWLNLPMADRLPGAELVVGSPATRVPDLAVFGAEATVVLPRLLTWRFPATGIDAETVAALPRDSAGHVTFGAYGDMRCITAETVALWASVLRAVPGATLLVGSANGVWPKTVTERLAQSFANFGLADRVSLQGPHESGKVNLDLCARVDILLDSAPVNGLNGVAEALWMGVPVVSLKGDRRAGCTGAAILEAADRSAWIASTADEYVTAAAGLAESADLAAVRAGLRDATAAAPLCDAKGFADLLIAALEARSGSAAHAA